MIVMMSLGDPFLQLRDRPCWQIFSSKSGVLCSTLLGTLWEAEPALCVCVLKMVTHSVSTSYIAILWWKHSAFTINMNKHSNFGVPSSCSSWKQVPNSWWILGGFFRQTHRFRWHLGGRTQDTKGYKWVQWFITPITVVYGTYNYSYWGL